MGVKRLEPEVLRTWVEELIELGRVVGVQAREERFVFDDLADAGDLRLDYDTTVLPPKKYVLPPEDRFLEFKDGEYQPLDRVEPYVLLGVHPYDMAAINQLDAIFLQGNLDAHYRALRQAAAIVVSDVERAGMNCFAGCMGTATVENGFDVLLTRVDGHYLLDWRTDRGEELAVPVMDAPDAGREDLLARERVWETNRKVLQQLKLKVPPETLPGLLAASWDDPIWEDKSELCFSCGSCNMVCPTCYCFDVHEDVNWDLTSGSRTRYWHSCMLEPFARVAGGHNFRKDKASRYRHRYYRKGKYIADKYGSSGCVGCGRCVDACPAKIANPVEVYNHLAEVSS
ncbi:MAG: 4Fe-4S dicluster domain-containing protein [bacterium]